MSHSLLHAVVASTLFGLSVEGAGPSSGGGGGGASAGAGAGAGGGGQGGSGSSWSNPANAEAKKLNFIFMRYLSIGLGAFAFSIVIYRVAVLTYARFRLMATAGSNRQGLFATMSSPYYASIKKHVLWAPFFRNRHNAEFQISQAINMGTLPTRFQGIFLIMYLAGNAILCAISIDWTAETGIWLGQLRNRTGILSIVNMIPLFIFAGRNNPLIYLLGISFDTYNLMHRWFGRIVVLQAIVHTGAYMANKILTVGMEGLGKSLTTVPYLTLGFVSTISFVILLLQSPSIFRHAFYETFLAIHFVVVLVAVLTLYFHLAIKQNKWLPYVQACIAIWIFDRLFRVGRVMYRNCGKQITSCTMEALPGEAIRLTFDMTRPWNFQPGQHAYVYLPRFGAWTSHPFSVAWYGTEQRIEYPDEKLAQYSQDLTSTKVKMSMVVKARTGFTDAIYQAAATAENNTVVTMGLVEGPYGGHHSLDSYGTAILFAGGIGITHQVPYVKHLVARFADGSVSTRKITLVWVLKSSEHLEWIRPWMAEILAMPMRRDVLKILLYVTKATSLEPIRSPSHTVQMFKSRPNFSEIMDTELAERVGTTVVTSCGPGGFTDAVRSVVRSKAHVGALDFIEESFTW